MPTVRFLPMDKEIEAGTTLRIMLIAVDEDGDPLVFELLEGPSNMVISYYGELIWTPFTEDIALRLVAAP